MATQPDALPAVSVLSGVGVVAALAIGGPMRRGMLIVAAVLGLAGPAWAQEEPQVEPGMAPADPGQEEQAKQNAEAPGLVRKAVEAMSKAQTFACRVRATGIGGLATRSPIVDATVRMGRAGDKEDFDWKFLVRGAARKCGESEGEAFGAG